jgi:DNA-binding response OmpR family regulator
MSDHPKEIESLLLVDDNPTNLQVLYQTLETTGCKLLVAKNGETALSIAQKASPDLILLDIMMPGIDGFEVCRRLKADRATAAIPVIFLSALTDTKDKVQGLQLGAVDYVSKPFQPDEVIARVNTHLTIHRLKREVEKKKDALENELKIVSDV